MKKLTTSILFTAMFFGALHLKAQQKSFIQVNASKALSLLTFLEASGEAHKRYRAYHEYINEHLGSDAEFQQLAKDYEDIYLNYLITRKEFPKSRYHHRVSVNDLIWSAAANATNLDDFNVRITGLLPYISQNTLYQTLKRAEPYYDKLVWNPAQASIEDIQKKLAPYLPEFERIFFKTNTFYQSGWTKDLPFKLAVYPIPLANGNTTATAKGNALICGFLAKRKNPHKDILGVIIHEICHTLYAEQPARLQRDIQQWFDENPSAFAPIANSYLDEALATVLGNGWANKELTGEMDPNPWYNNRYIDGFARALYPLTEEYLKADKPIDKAYIDQSVVLFANTFPKADKTPATLLSEINFYLNAEKEEDIDRIEGTLYKYFNPFPHEYLIPIDDPSSIESFAVKKLTKLIIVDSKNTPTLALIDRHFPDQKVEAKANSIFSFRDESSQSAVVIINVKNQGMLEKALIRLSKQAYLEFGEYIIIQ
ncbi:MAG: hypothetical protein HEP71_01085 [Roseivirga sp.]|nr:hypothetical protein [Roseivirga sp.]